MPGLMQCVGNSGLVMTASGGAVTCPYRRARVCPSPGGALANVWMLQTEAATITGAFQIIGGDGTCYYFDFDDPLVCAGADVYRASDVTTYLDCETCGGDPCAEGAVLDESCETLLVRFNRKIDQFYPTAIDDPDPCGGTPAIAGTPSPVNGVATEANVDTPPPGATGVVASEPNRIWGDDVGELAVGRRCPTCGWFVADSGPNNWDVCTSCRPAGLKPHTPPAYPDVICCQGPFETDTSPTGFYAQRVTITDIEVECDDAP